MTFFASLRQVPKEDLAAGVGLLLIAIGVFFIFKPAALVLAGAALLVYAFATHAANVKNPPASAPAKSSEAK
jgi:sterol desaturase/sphingolipid hydroxylase (fatty acid hydroxylase superfamily)